jgi:hypothetical protein
MKKILIVGIGNFGAWWALSLIKIKFPIQIYCFDIDASKYEVLKNRLSKDKSYILTINNFIFLNDLTEAPKKFDTIIVSSNADVRLKIIHNLRDHFCSNKWIIEKVLVQSPTQLKLLKDILEGQIVYVNHCRRLQPAINFCKTLLEKKPLPTSIKYLGGRWELASNSFHFIDLLSYWFKSGLVNLDTNYLHNQWHKSSTRKGFFDIKGMLLANFSNGLQLKMDWTNGQKNSLWIFSYLDGEVLYDEFTGKILDNGKIVAIIPLVNFSQMGSLLEPIFTQSTFKENNLPSLLEVYQNTRLILESYLSHWQKKIDNQSKVIPIS